MSSRQPDAARHSHLARVRVGDVMHADVISCAPDTPLRQVAALMVASRVHSVVVIGVGEGRLPTAWGVIASRDLVQAALQEPEDWTARDVAITEAVRVSSGDGIEHAVDLMVDHQVDHLIVVGAEDGRPVGVLSTLDVAALVA